MERIAATALERQWWSTEEGENKNKYWEMNSPLFAPTTYLKVYHNVLVFKLDEVMTIKVFGPFL